jgi:hypothetical protein
LRPKTDAEKRKVPGAAGTESEPGDRGSNGGPLPSSSPTKPFDAPAELAHIAVLSLRKLKAILLVPLPIEALDGRAKGLRSAMALARLQLAAAEAALRLQVRIDRNRLRRQEIDRVPELLRIIAEERAMLAQGRTIDATPHKPR